MNFSMSDALVQNVSKTPSQHEQWQKEEHADQLAYWKHQLKEVPLALDLPIDRPRTSGLSPVTARYPFTLPQQLSNALKMLSRQEEVSFFMLLFTALQILLHHYTGQEDLLVGTSSMERTPTECMFVNFLVLRTRVADNPLFRELLRQVREVVLMAYVHQNVPFEQIVQALHQERNTRSYPICQVMFTLEEVPIENLDELALNLPSLEIEAGSEIANLDLAIFVQDAVKVTSGYIEYNANLFDVKTITRMISHWQRLLESIVTNPDKRIADFPLLSDAEWYQQVVEWNATQVNYPQNLCLHQLFEAQVERTPEAVSVVFEQEQLTYRELNNRANQLAHFLHDLGVGPETVVSLLVERGIAFLVAILAVFKVGGAYLPLDTHHPPTRILRVLEHSSSRFILATKNFVPLLSQTLVDMNVDEHPQIVIIEDILFSNECIEGNLPTHVTPYNLAYVIYTSGSTGMPKGAMIEHRGMLNHIYAKVTTLHVTATTTVAQTASQCFDISVWQFLAVLLVGGRVHIFNDEVAHNPVQLLTQVEQHQISILEIVPSLLRVMLEEIESRGNACPHLEKLRWLVSTGEALAPELCWRWLKVYPNIPLLNAYGPTECSDDVTHFPIYQPLTDTRIHIPIGRPVNNMQLYILDRRLRPQPIGVSGELYVGGIGVGRGYLNDALRTAEAFVVDPFSNEPGMRLYKTGDLVRYLSDGNIEFLGRIDHQVKIRGYRIELGEIEAVLHQHPDVQDVVIIAREDVPDDKYLAAYIVASTGVTRNNLRTFLKEKLPEYMIPSTFMLLDTLPLNSNGKVDRRALPIPEQLRHEIEETFVAPMMPVQEQLKQIWEELLEVRPIGIKDNFFELGGHSLLAVRLVSRIEQVWGKKISSATLLKGATIEQLSTILVQPEVAIPETTLEQVKANNSKHPFFLKGQLASSVRSIFSNLTRR